MNYYEHHLGDYMRDTAHLSILEDGVYRRLIDAYYIKEAPLPAELTKCYKLARAQSKAERSAVDAVLEEFFILDDDGFHNKRCDEEIKKFQGKKPEIDEKRENDKERQRRARERRKALFNELSGLGVHMAWNATTAELEAELSRVMSQPVTQPVTRDNTATIHQSPVTSHQTPDIKPFMDTSSHQSNVTDGDDPKQPGEWFGWFNRNHGTQYDAKSLHDRKTLMQIFTRWTTSHITPQRVNEAVDQAIRTAKGPIANLAAYVDRVLISMDAEQSHMTAGQRRNANLEKAFDEFLGESKPDQETIIEGECRHE